MKKLTLKYLFLLLALGGTLAVTGCHTAEGFGEDIEQAGEGLQRTVR